MRNDIQILASAQAGYDRAPDTTLWSSPCWLAYQAGKAVSAMTRPVKAHMSRGYSVRLELGSGTQVLVRFSGKELDSFTIERL